MSYMSDYPQPPEGGDPWAWAWRRVLHEGDFQGTYYGASQYHSAVVRYSSTGWQATMNGTSSAASGHLEQRSPYRVTVAAAKAWAERYGKPRPARRR